MTLEESIGMEAFDPRLLSDTALPLDSLDMEQAEQALAWCDGQLALWRSTDETVTESWGKLEKMSSALSNGTDGYPDPCWVIAAMMRSAVHQHACMHVMADRRIKELERMRAVLAESLGVQ